MALTEAGFTEGDGKQIIASVRQKTKAWRIPANRVIQKQIA